MLIYLSNFQIIFKYFEFTLLLKYTLFIKILDAKTNIKIGKGKLFKI